MGKEAQVEIGKGRALRSGLHVVLQAMQILRKTGLILRVKLDDPRVVFEFIKTVLQGVFQCVAGLRQPYGFTAFGSERGQFKEGGDRVAVFQQHAVGFGQVFHPRQ